MDLPDTEPRTVFLPDHDRGNLNLVVRFLIRFFETRNLLPFAIYCLAFGAISIIRFA